MGDEEGSPRSHSQMSTNKHLGSWLRMVRTTRGVSQPARARDLNVERPTVSRWESGLYPIHHEASMELPGVSGSGKSRGHRD
jgi:DNA-binding transcriptional regulator YiaG